MQDYSPSVWTYSSSRPGSSADWSQHSKGFLQHPNALLSNPAGDLRRSRAPSIDELARDDDQTPVERGRMMVPVIARGAARVKKNRELHRSNANDGDL